MDNLQRRGRIPLERGSELRLFQGVLLRPLACLQVVLLLPLLISSGCQSQRPDTKSSRITQTQANEQPVTPVLPPLGTRTVPAGPLPLPEPVPTVPMPLVPALPVAPPTLEAVPPVPVPRASFPADSPLRPLPKQDRFSGDSWQSLNRWLATHQWPSAQFSVLAQNTRVNLKIPTGDWTLQLGSQRAFWNGMLIQLGFEPRAIVHDVLVHSLDVEKHLDPLAAAGAAAWTGPRIIVLDPGHGGAQPGSRSIIGNQLEKDLTLDWALRLRALLQAQGWEVHLTRTNDFYMSLAERVDFSEHSGAALFISLHLNSSFPNQEAQGIETYTTTPQGMNSHLTREYADDPTRPYPNNRYDEESFSLAVRIHRSLITRSGATDRGVRHARFMDVLRWQNRPALLVEGGFLSNPAEALKIASPAYRQKLAAAIAEALR